jgi:hypothetical protein
MDQWEQTKKFIETARVALEAETREVAHLFNRFNENLAKAVTGLWRQFLFIWGAVIVLAFSFLFIIAYTSLSRDLAHTPGGPGGPVKPGQLVKASATASETLPGLPEKEDLLEVLNQIRLAQYKKDIDMFLNVYSPTFPNLGEKREITINIWRRYDYIDLQFNISDIQPKDTSKIFGTVTWNIKARDRMGDEIKVLCKTYHVKFSKESGRWLIHNLEALKDKGV